MAVAILQARMSSNRLPGKVMRPLLGQPMILRQIERLRRCRRLDRIVVATSSSPSDDPLADCLKDAGVEVVRGPLDDVLERYRLALLAVGSPRDFVRLTADCPLADPEVIDLCVASHVAVGADYTYNYEGRTFPKGLDVEVCATRALLEAASEAADPYEREHVMPFIYRRPDRFSLNAITRDPPLRFRWTVDTAEDFAFVTAVYTDLYPENPAFTSADILAWQTRHPDHVIPNLEA